MLSNIRAKNFLSWKDLNFNVVKGATLIDGWNDDDGRSEGSGKSAILNAVCWNLFGCLPKEANVDDVIKDGEKSCEVVLEFDNGDAIVRTRKPNDLYILKAGATIKGKDAKETQSLIEEYIGMNFETFCQSIYFAQNYDKKFLTSGQADKGKILSSIQNLQVFDKARKEVMDLASAEDKKITSLRNQLQVEENNIKNLKSQHALITSFIEDKIKKHQAQASNLNQQKMMVTGNVARLASDIDSTNLKMSEIDLNSLQNDETELNAAKSQYVTDLSAVTYQKTQIDTIRRSILAKENEGKTLATKYNTLQNKKQNLSNIELNPTYLNLLTQRKAQEEFHKSLSYKRLDDKRIQLIEYINNPTKICPSCGSELKNIDTSHVKQELNAIIAQMDGMASDSASFIENIDKQIVSLGEQLSKDSENIDVDIADVLTQLQVISDYLDQNKVPSIDDLNAKEKELKSVISQIDDALGQTQSKKMQHLQLKSKLDMLVRQQTDYMMQLSQIDQAIEQLGEPDVSGDEAKLQNIVIEMDQVAFKYDEINRLLEESKSYVQRLETLKDGFKEIKSYVFTNALNELNYRANQYLNDLFDVEASIKFTSEDQKIETKITLDGKDRSLGLLSGGQNRRFNLAVDLALSDIVSQRKTSKLDLLVFDEYFKDLSEISMEKSLDLLKSRKCPVLLIEHNTLFKNIVDNTFFVRLQDGTSTESRA